MSHAIRSLISLPFRATIIIGIFSQTRYHWIKILRSTEWWESFLATEAWWRSMDHPSLHGTRQVAIQQLHLTMQNHLILSQGLSIYHMVMAFDIHSSPYDNDIVVAALYLTCVHHLQFHSAVNSIIVEWGEQFRI